METPFVAGVCLAYMPSVSYNGVGCYPFVYGGCGGTRNRFRTLEECTKVCMDSEFLKQTMVVLYLKNLILQVRVRTSRPRPARTAANRSPATPLTGRSARSSASPAAETGTTSQPRTYARGPVSRGNHVTISINDKLQPICFNYENNPLQMILAWNFLVGPHG